MKPLISVTLLLCLASLTVGAPSANANFDETGGHLEIDIPPPSSLLPSGSNQAGSSAGSFPLSNLIDPVTGALQAGADSVGQLANGATQAAQNGLGTGTATLGQLGQLAQSLNPTQLSNLLGQLTNGATPAAQNGMGTATLGQLGQLAQILNPAQLSHFIDPVTGAIKEGTNLLGQLTNGATQAAQNGLGMGTAALGQLGQLPLNLIPGALNQFGQMTNQQVNQQAGSLLGDLSVICSPTMQGRRGSEQISLACKVISAPGLSRCLTAPLQQVQQAAQQVAQQSSMFNPFDFVGRILNGVGHTVGGILGIRPSQGQANAQLGGPSFSAGANFQG